MADGTIKGELIYPILGLLDENKTDKIFTYSFTLYIHGLPGSSVVEHLPRHSKVEGLSPSTDVIFKRDNGKILHSLIRPMAVEQLGEQSTSDPTFVG